MIVLLSEQKLHIVHHLQNLTSILFLFSQTLLTAISMSAIATNGVVPGRKCCIHFFVFILLAIFKCNGFPTSMEIQWSIFFSARLKDLATLIIPINSLIWPSLNTVYYGDCIMTQQNISPFVQQNFCGKWKLKTNLVISYLTVL